MRIFQQLSNMLLVVLILTVGHASTADRQYVYALRGRAIDSSGRPVVGALVFLNPLKEDDQVFGSVTDGAGMFNVKESTTVRRAARRLYVTGPIPSNSVELIRPPFNLLPRLTDTAFSGLEVTLKENEEIAVGDVPIQVTYHKVVLPLKKNGGHSVNSKDGWRAVWLRVKNSNGGTIEATSLSEVNLKSALSVVESSLTVSIPDGNWIIESSVSGHGGPWASTFEISAGIDVKGGASVRLKTPQVFPK